MSLNRKNDLKAVVFSTKRRASYAATYLLTCVKSLKGRAVHLNNSFKVFSDSLQVTQAAAYLIVWLGNWLRKAQTEYLYVSLNGRPYGRRTARYVVVERNRFLGDELPPSYYFNPRLRHLKPCGPQWEC